MLWAEQVGLDALDAHLQRAQRIHEQGELPPDETDEHASRVAAFLGGDEVIDE